MVKVSEQPVRQYEMAAAAGELARKALATFGAGSELAAVAEAAAMRALKESGSLDQTSLQNALRAAYDAIKAKIFVKGEAAKSVAAGAQKMAPTAAGYTDKLKGKKGTDLREAEAMGQRLFALGRSEKTLEAGCEGLACIINDSDWS